MAQSDSKERSTLHQGGSCLCGAVKFMVDGEIIFNELCHCRACGRARGMTPVHLIGIKGDFTFVQGETNVKIVPGMGTMTHAICSQCGVGLYQRPKGMSFYATFPTTFQIETPATANDDDSSTTKRQIPSSLLPLHLQPKYHCNYENRLMNYYDSLPKYQTFVSAGILITNEGEIIEERKDVTGV